MIACFNYLVGLCPNRQAGATSDGSNGNDLALFLFFFVFFPRNIANQFAAKIKREWAVKQNVSPHRKSASSFRSKGRYSLI